MGEPSIYKNHYNIEYLPFLSCSPVRHHSHLGQEPGTLLLPVVKCRRRCYDKKRPPDAVDLSKVGEERDRLYGLSQAHLVSQYTINALAVEVGKPIHTLHSNDKETGQLGDTAAA